MENSYELLGNRQSSHHFADSLLMQSILWLVTSRVLDWGHTKLYDCYALFSPKIAMRRSSTVLSRVYLLGLPSQKGLYSAAIPISAEEDASS